MLFVFAGQGSQWATMGQGLLRFPVFAEKLAECDRLFLPELGWSIQAHFEAPAATSQVEGSLVAQPCLFSLQVSLCALLRSWGLVPDGVIGHSVGEVAAAHVAGALSLEEAVRVIARQNEVMARIQGAGRMLFAAIAPSELDGLDLSQRERLSVAAINSPRSCVLSGDEVLADVASWLTERQRFWRMLNIDIPFHSPTIDGHMAYLEQMITMPESRPFAVPIYSTLRGELAQPGDFGGEYWARHMRQPTLFSDALTLAVRQGYRVFMEIGPHPVLAQAIDETVQACGSKNYLSLNSLRRGAPDDLEVLAQLTRLNVVAGKAVQVPEAEQQLMAYWAEELRQAAAAAHDPLVDLPAHQRRPWLVKLVGQALHDLSEGKVQAEAQETQGFLDMGLSSLAALRLTQILSQKLNRKLPATLLFEYADTRSLVDYLLGVTPSEEPTRTKTTHHDEPIAIIGMACRFPGGANSLGEYWQLLASCRDAIGEIPADRWSADAFYDPNPDAPGKSYSRWGGFLNVSLQAFDAFFFNMGPREAQALDPQQRLLLECAWEALEDAQLRPSRLRRRPVGVFVGISTDDYKGHHLWSGDFKNIDGYSALGSMFSSAGGRLSYVLGLQGPNFSIDTACSSSLVALHQASASLRAGESELALVAGVNCMTHPALYVYFSKLRALSPEGRCKTFSDAADGYSRGEGCAVIVLKPLAKAQADGDTVQAVILASGVNQDGASSSFTAPNGKAQEALVGDVLAQAGVQPHEVDYVEAHGTGTPLGDPIEVHALARSYGVGRQEPLWIGSVKANMGHLEACAGLAGLLKLVLALNHEELPRHRLVGSLNPAVSWDQLPVQVLRENKPWQRGLRRRIAGLSSFGFSGTNTHVLVAEAPLPTVSAETAQTPAWPLLLTLSGLDYDALLAQASQFSHILKAHVDARSVCYGANTGRERFAERVAVVGSCAEELTQQLDLFGLHQNGAYVTGSRVRQEPEVVWVFGGQGTQFPGMGRALYDGQPRFRKALDELALTMDPLLNRSLVALVTDDAIAEADLADTQFTQPALFAFEYALAQVWLGLGVRPAAVMGHSVGEVVAATIAGVFSPEAAAQLICMRAKFMAEVPRGGMATVFASEARVRALIEAADLQLSYDAMDAPAVVAAVNGPETVTVSGSPERIAKLCELATADGLRSKTLRVSHAFHNPILAKAADRLAAFATSLRLNRPNLPVVTNLTGTYATGEALVSPSYWREQLCAPVLFYQGLSRLAEDGHRVFLEIGPTAALSSLGQSAFPEAVFLPSQRGREQAALQMATAAAQLFCLGVELDLREWDGQPAPARVKLPTYPFQRKRFWMEPGLPKPIRPAGHALLGQRFQSLALGKTLVYEQTYRSDAPDFMREHYVFGKAVAPAAAQLCCLLAAQTSDLTAYQFGDLQFMVPLAVAEGSSLTAQWLFEGEDEGRQPFRLVSKAEAGDEWITHTVGVAVPQTNPVELPSLASLQARMDTPEDVATFYADLDRFGFLALGESFRAIRSVTTGRGEALATVQLEPSRQTSYGCAIDPGLMDSMLQTCVFGAGALRSAFADGKLHIPMGLGELQFLAKPWGPQLLVHSRVRQLQERVWEADLVVYDSDGTPCLVLNRLALTRVEAAHFSEQEAAAEDLFVETWVPAACSSKPTGRVIACVQPGPGADALCEQVQAQGLSLLRVEPGRETLELRDGHWTLNPAGEGLAGLMGYVAATAEGPQRVLYLWGLDAGPKGDVAGLEDLAPQIELKTSGLLQLARAIGDTEIEQLRLLVATAVPTDPSRLSSCPLWGMGLVLGQELGSQWGCVVELADPLAAIASDLVSLAFAEDLGDRYRLSSGQLTAAQLTPYAAPLASPVQVDAEALYLVSGGLGELGLASVARLMACGARHFLLLGRQVRAESERRCLSLRQAGARLTVLTVPLGEPGALSQIEAAVKASGRTLGGVIHAAGVLDDGALAQQTPARLRAVLAGKALGAWQLHLLTQTQPKAFFVMFGSAVTTVGNPGQVSYAAANAFLDGLAAFRRQEGLPATTIAWGPWDQVGMATSQKRRETLGNRGLQPLDPKRCLDLLLQSLTDELPARLTVLRVNWSRFGEQIRPTEHTYYQQFLDGGPRPVKQAGPNLDFESIPAGERRNALSQVVHQVAACVLGLAANAYLDPQTPLQEQGFDSLMAVELRTRLGTAVGLDLSVSLLYNHPTVAKLTDYLFERLSALISASSEQALTPVGGSASTDEDFAYLDGLSEDELEALILRDLQGARSM